MQLYVMGSILAAAAAGEIGAVSSIVDQGVTLSNMSSAAVLGVVAVASVTGLIWLYKDKNKDQEDLKVIIKESSTAIAKNSEVLERLSEKITECQKK